MSIAPIQGSSFLAGAGKSQSIVGTNVLGFCSKCQANTTHTVITVVAGTRDRPDKVMCNSCKQERRFKPPRNSSQQKREEKGKVVVDLDNENDLDFEKAAPIFQDDEGRKRPKSKAKKKDEDKDDSLLIQRNTPSLPLSLQQASPDDIALYQNKRSAFEAYPTVVKTYKATERFNVGDVIEHKVFGLGFVLAEQGMNKIEVLFSQGRKLLVCAPK